MEIRKVFKNGNSIVVALPSQFVQELELAPGAFVSMEYNPLERCIRLVPVQKDRPGTPSALVEFLENYGQVLGELDDETD
jgi:antitoxin component of MazEF toxin-antitoxin module